MTLQPCITSAVVSAQASLTRFPRRYLSFRCVYGVAIPTDLLASNQLRLVVTVAIARQSPRGGVYWQLLLGIHWDFEGW